MDNILKGLTPLGTKPSWAEVASAMRIAFVVDRYWPLMTAASRVLDLVARYLRQQGHDVMILTAQVDHHWPETITVREVPVRRFGLDSWSLFGRKSLGQRVAQWLERNADQWDLLVVCELVDGGHYLFQVADQLGRPCLLSFFESGTASPLGELLEAPLPGTRAPVSAKTGSIPRRGLWLARKHWTVPDIQVAAEVQKHCPLAQVVPWGLGIPEWPILSDHERRGIRAAICHSRADFERFCRQPLIVYHGHCMPGRDSQWLWQLLAGLCERRSEVCAWVTGDGAAIHGLWRQANEAGLEDRIIFPGIFNDLSDLFSAADLIVLPQLERRHDYDWLAAVATGTPCLVAQSPGTDGVIHRLKPSPEADPLWTTVQSRDLQLWWRQAFNVLDHPEVARTQATRQRAALLLHDHQIDTFVQYEQVLIQVREDS